MSPVDSLRRYVSTTPIFAKHSARMYASVLAITLQWLFHLIQNAQYACSPMLITRHGARIDIIFPQNIYLNSNTARRRLDRHSASPVPLPYSPLNQLDDSFTSSKRRQNTDLSISSSRSGSPFLEPLNMSPGGSVHSASDLATPTGRANQLPKLVATNVQVEKWRKGFILDSTSSRSGADGGDSIADAAVAEPSLRQEGISSSPGLRRDSSEPGLKREDLGAGINKQLQDISSNTKEKKQAWKKVNGRTCCVHDSDAWPYDMVPPSDTRRLLLSCY